MNKTVFIFLTIVCSGFLIGKIHAQDKETKQKLIGIEGGIDPIYSELTNENYIRGDASMRYYGGYNESAKTLSILFHKSYVGVKSELFLISNKLSISGGLRYSRMVGSVGKDTYWSFTSDYFYLLYRQENTNTEFLKIKEITQISHYIGIPLEIRLMSRKYYAGQLYFKAGVELNCKLATKTEVSFSNDDMKSFESGVSDIVGKPHPFNSIFYGGIGIMYGKLTGFNVSFEATVPSIFLTKEISGLVNPISGGGIKLIIQFPNKSKQQ